MKLNTRFNYQKSQSSIVSGSRIYDINGEKLPSVTTILKATESEEKRESLRLWRRKIGDTAADEIMKKSSTRGTKMHKHLEEYLIGQTKMDLGSDDSYIMSQKIINESLKIKLSEVWGSEVNLFYPKKYAGTADLICKYQGQDVLVDFKQSNRPKKSDYIQDYFLQLGAYTLAHDVVYGTKMKAGIILLCTVDNLFQEFKIESAELEMYQNLFLGRVKKFYEINNIT